MKFIIALVFAALGYPLSYMFQNELVKAKLPFYPDYFTHFLDVVKAVNSEMPSVGWTAIGSMVACGVIGFLLSAALSKK